MCPIFPGKERFIERDSSGNVIRSWSKLMASADYHTLPPGHILDGQAIRLDWSGTATSINGLTGNPYSFIDQFVNYNTMIHSGRVVVPKGFPLMPSGFSLDRTTVDGVSVTIPNRYAGDTMDQTNLNRLRIANFDEDSSGNYSGIMLGVALKDYYMPIYGRQLSEALAVVREGTIEIPFFQSTNAAGGRELARLVTQITALAKNTNTDDDIAVGDDVTVGTGVDRGRFVKIGASNASSYVVGQIVALETVDVSLGIAGWMQLKQFNPFMLFREASWYTDYDVTEAMTFPTGFDNDFMLPPINWFGRGQRHLTDGGEYRMTVTDTAEWTNGAVPAATYTVDIGPYFATFAGAKIVRADGTEISPTNAFTTADVTIVSTTVNGADDAGGVWTVTAVDDNTIDSAYAQHINVTFTRGAGAPAALSEVTVEFSVVGKGQHTGLPVSLDSATVVGIAQVKLTLG